ncbi:hypothetical protein D3C71_2050330 [compost metagenome]
MAFVEIERGVEIEIVAARIAHQLQHADRIEPFDPARIDFGGALGRLLERLADGDRMFEGPASGKA